MAMCMNDYKVRRVGRYFKQRLSGGWEIIDDKRVFGLNYGSVVATRGDVRVAMDIGWAPYLRVNVGKDYDDLIELPNIEGEKLGKLMASIANVIAGAREHEDFNKEEA